MQQSGGGNILGKLHDRPLDDGGQVVVPALSVLAYDACYPATIDDNVVEATRDLVFVLHPRLKVRYGKWMMTLT